MTADSLDIENTRALAAFLRDTGRVGRDEPLVIHVLAGGVSNRTVSVRRATGETWVLKQALPKLRVQVDWFSQPQRNQREAAGMRWLGQLAPPGAIPQLVFEDHDQHLLAMEAVPDPHQNWKTLLLSGRVQPRRVAQFAELLGTIHGRASQRAHEIAPLFDDRQYFQSLRLEPYYQYTAAHVPQTADFFRDLIQQTVATRQSLVHGDFSPKNILVHGRRMVLVDHEVIHWGDPAFDLGFALTHLLSKAHFLPEQRGAFASAACQFWQHYREALGPLPWADPLEQRAVRHTLGCLLARVAGRSPLEYLDQPHRRRQQDVVLDLMPHPPRTVGELTERFLARL